MDQVSADRRLGIALPKDEKKITGRGKERELSEGKLSRASARVMANLSLPRSRRIPGERLSHLVTGKARLVFAGVNLRGNLLHIWIRLDGETQALWVPRAHISYFDDILRSLPEEDRPMVAAEYARLYVKTFYGRIPEIKVRPATRMSAWPVTPLCESALEDKINRGNGPTIGRRTRTGTILRLLKSEERL